MTIVSDEQTLVIQSSSPVTLVVSDTTTLVTEGNESVSYPHAAVASSNSGAWGSPSNYTFPNSAIWIWEAAVPTNPLVDQTVMLQKSFNINAQINSAILRVVVDDTCTFWLNGALVGSATGYAAATEWNVTNLLQQGTNILTAQINNIGITTTNPAGVRFQIVADAVSNDIYPAVPAWTPTVLVWGFLSDFHFSASAKYIWQSYYVIDPLVQTTVRFQRTFDLPYAIATITDATLYIGADDKYTVWLNGHYIGTRQNWTVTKMYDVAAYVQQGANILTIEGLNIGTPGTTPTTNPAMIVFQLNINGPSDVHSFPWIGKFRMYKVKEVV